MAYCKELIAAKLRRWEKYLLRFRLPSWEAIPNMGLYMEQVVELPLTKEEAATFHACCEGIRANMAHLNDL